MYIWLVTIKLLICLIQEVNAWCTCMSLDHQVAMLQMNIAIILPF